MHACGCADVQHITHFGSWKVCGFALRMCFGLHWGGSALRGFLGQVDRMGWQTLRLPNSDGHVHVADGFRSDGVLTIGR